MTVSMMRLNEILDACETPIRSYPSASGYITDNVYRMIKSEYRALRHKLRSMHKHDWRYGALLRHVRSIKLDMDRRKLEFSISI